jgi:N-acetylmuramic acid 6-phosphate (MurNAc-6-P) etherase
MLALKAVPSKKTILILLFYLEVKMKRSEIEADLIKISMLPITEQQNELTKNIDLCKNGLEILELLQKTDQEIFDGWKYGSDLKKTNGLKTEIDIIRKLSSISQMLADSFQRSIDSEDYNFKLILSGCGTSGRLAYLCSQTFNAYFKAKFKTTRDVCYYIIAGDEFALVNSVESVEDKPQVGREKLKSLIADSNTKFVFIGITCGFSAPFVGGQLDLCLNYSNINDNQCICCGIMGFNPARMARNSIPFNEKGETFLDLIQKLELLELNEPEKYFILNPLIGPEPITGSSRMKSGTTTKIMLDMILTKSISLLNRVQVIDELRLVNFYEQVAENVIYSVENKLELAQVIDKAANSLRNLKQGGSVNYLCDSKRLGLLCCVDASECVPTYGANKNDFKGFVSSRNTPNEWTGFLKECQSVNVGNIGANLGDFTSKNCLFISVNDDEDYEADGFDQQVIKTYIEHLLESKSECTLVHLNLVRSKNPIENDSKALKVSLSGLKDIIHEANQEIDAYFGMCLQEFALKLTINAISTGAHVLIGKVYQNIMVDVRVSNLKLYWRALGIIKTLTQNSKTDQQCEKYLLESIYAGDLQRIKEIEGLYGRDEIALLEKHVEQATEKDLIVPLALVMALGDIEYNEAKNLLAQSNNLVRNCISQRPA